MIRVQIVGDKQVIYHLGQVSPRVDGLVRQAVEREAINLTRYVKENKLSGQVLRARPPGGHLRRSVNYKMQETGDAIMGSVGTNVVYAAIHEYGGVTRAHVILPRRKKALAFQAGGQSLVRKSVQHPGSKMPERSYLRSSLKENADRIKAAIAAAVARGVKG